MTGADTLPATRAEAPLSRFAEAIFWLARYVERAENLARIIDVQETFARDRLGASNWRSIVQLQADEALFYDRHAVASAGTVIEFYMLDGDNPHSVKSSIALARANARAHRPSISTEMWTQLNMFHNWLQGLGADDVALHDVSRLCARIKEDCQTHYGITEGTFYRDQGWQFYRLGKAIERADQTTRLLDIKYHLLLPAPDVVGSPLDESQWNALLRAVAGYHAYRRVHPRGISHDRVAGFLLFDRSFPRSVKANVDEVADRLAILGRDYGLRTDAAVAHVGELRRVFDERSIEQVVAQGLHEFNDWLQGELIALTDALGVAFFGHRDAQ